MLLSEKIKKIRKTENLTQTKFGEKLGVSRDVISSFESGRVEPKPLFINHLCISFNINKDWLLTGTGNMYKFKNNIANLELKDRIKLIRKSKNISQSDFGKKLKISQSQIASYETGYRNIPDRTINDICREFNVNKEWLVTGTGDMHNSKNNIANLELKESICDIVMKINNVDSLINIKNLSNLLLNLDK